MDCRVLDKYQGKIWYIATLKASTAGAADMKSPLIVVLTIFLFTLQGCSDFFNDSKNQDKSETNQGPPVSGKVLNAMRGGGYTYIELENNGKIFWIASSVINVKRNDEVTWEGGSVMTNFTSYALNRKFDEVHFVKSIKIVR
jgi:hypothetical protein